MISLCVKMYPMICLCLEVSWMVCNCLKVSLDGLSLSQGVLVSLICLKVSRRWSVFDSRCLGWSVLSQGVLSGLFLSQVVMDYLYV